MALKVNGTTIPWSALFAILAAFSWVGGMSYQVIANADELEKIESLPTDIALIQQDLKYTKDALKAIAEALNVKVVEDTIISTEGKDSELDNSPEKVSATKD